jgi:hydroxymethylpyrimidine pyrophosphatase-like HAD family hydrolase
VYNAIKVMILFISDIDKTLLYSNCPGNVCVEYSEDRPVTYMTATAVATFNQIISSGRLLFIPCTLRSYEQTSRIGVFNKIKERIFICDNGFSVYEDGQLDKSWDDEMQERLKHYPNAPTLTKIRECVESNHLNVCKIKSNRDAFYTLIFTCADEASYGMQLLSACMNNDPYRLELQGRKLYVIPDFLDKSLAVEYIINKFTPECIITSGDSSVDQKFVCLGDVKIIPSHSTINIDGALITKSAGINAGEEILATVSEIGEREGV